jgi:AraC-like DNA-binding protein
MAGHTHFTEALFCFASLLFCWLTGIIVLLYSAKSQPRLCLGFSYIAMGYAFAMAGMTYGGLIELFPHFYRTGNIGWLIVMPLSWLYVRTTVTRTGLKAFDLIHLIPALLYIVDYFPFFILPAELKAQIYRADISNLDKLMRYGQGWLLPQNAQFDIRYLQMAVYWSLQIRLLSSQDALEIRKDKPVFNWLITYTVLEIFLFLPFVCYTIMGLQKNPWISTISPCVAFALSAITLILNPGILYGRSSAATVPSPAKPKPQPDFDGSREITARLDILMQRQKPFLNPDYTLKELAEAIDLPSHKLSAYLSQIADTNFNEYINRWRIQYCLELARNGEIVNLNQNGIAAKCGFNNRQTFSAAFRKITGGYPSSYFNETADS